MLVGRDLTYRRYTRGIGSEHIYGISLIVNSRTISEGGDLANFLLPCNSNHCEIFASTRDYMFVDRLGFFISDSLRNRKLNSRCDKLSPLSETGVVLSWLSDFPFLRPTWKWSKMEKRQPVVWRCSRMDAIPSSLETYFLNIRDWEANRAFSHEYSPIQGDIGMFVHTIIR